MSLAMRITGIGLVGGFGCGTAALRQALQQKSAPLSHVELRGHAFPLFKADTTPLEDYINKRSLRRIDHFSRMALLGAFQAMADANLQGVAPDRIGVVIGSGYGALNTTFSFLDSVIDDGDTCASPTAFSNSVHNAAAAHISMQLKLTGPSLTVSQFDQSFVSGLVTAQQWLKEKRVDAVLCGVVDEYSNVLGYCWERYFRTQGNDATQPLGSCTHNHIAGEGAAFFVLQPDSETITGYACITRAEMGRIPNSLPRIPLELPLVIDCDGRPLSGSSYRQHIAADQPVACYTPLYGASPVSAGFDLAVAALSLQQQQLFPSVARGKMYPGSVVDDVYACRELGCLRFGAHGEYTTIRSVSCL